MTNITPIINAIIALLAALITAFVIPWLKNKVGAQNMDKFHAWVKILVAAAEQTYLATQGDLKKRYVIARLEELGYTFDELTVSDAIESAVLELHHELYGAAPAVVEDKYGEIE